MTYTKNTWKTGDVVTSEKLNHMEDGIANTGGVLVVTLMGDNTSLDSSWQTIHDAMLSNGAVFGGTDYVETITSCSRNGSKYFVEIGNNSYATSAADGFPRNDED